MKRTLPRTLWWARGLACFLCISLLTLAGCETYKLQGRVIDGPTSAVTLVDADDPRLEASMGIAGARVSGLLDPRELSRKDLGTVTADETGRFSIPVDELGAGVFEYEVRVIARMRDSEPAMRVMELPPNEKRLLIMLAPGRDSNPAPTDYIRETMEMSEPWQ